MAEKLSPWCKKAKIAMVASGDMLIIHGYGSRAVEKWRL